MKKCYVTTPIYYASGLPQIGNSYSTIACDIFARYNRLMNRDTFFLTGMDEHGQKIEKAAIKANKDTQAYVDEIAIGTKDIWKHLNIANDGFIRTTDTNHVECVKKIFKKMQDNDDIYLGSYEGHYCVECEAFFTEKQLLEGNICPDCGRPTKLVKEESYFLRLKKYAPELLQHIKDNPDFIQPETRKNEVVSFIESGLEDLCVSRTSFKWGIPVDSNPEHVVYVWIDALSNYLSALGYLSSDDTNYQNYWVNNDRVYHVIGKDILRFHAVYWPIMLFSIGVPVNFKLIAHGWILTREGKMSKSKGNAVYPKDLYDRYSADSIRYYLAKEMPLGNDGLFSYDRFIERYNTELVNDLGNLVSRSISMVEKYCNGIIPNKYSPTEYDKDLELIAKEAIITAINSYDKFELQNAVNAIWTLVNRCNKYIDETCPWILAKEEEKSSELSSVMYHLIESIRVIACLLAPVLTESSIKMLNSIGINDEINLESLEFGHTYENIKVTKIDHLFSRLDEEKELEHYKKLQDERLSLINPKLNTKDIINFSEWEKLDIRVGKVLESKKVEGSNKLLVSKILVDKTTLQVVSGIAEQYNPQDIIGKNVLVVVNLEKAFIRGIESEGMILCCENGKKLELINVSSESGSLVK